MKIDAHQHFWIYAPETHAWITEELKVLKHNFLPEKLQPELQQHGFDGCVAVQAAQTETENNFLLDLADKYGFIKGVVGWVDLQAENVEDRLSAYADHPKFCGIRHIVQDEPDDRFMLHENFMRGIGKLKQFGLTYDILVFERQMPAAVEFTRQFPEQPFVLDHLGKPLIKEQRLNPWKKHFRELAAFPNMYCKLSGIVTEANWHGWQPDDFKPFLDEALNAFGVDRLMVGSDWPVCLLSARYRSTVELVENYFGELSELDRQKIFGQNAADFYGLK